MALVDGNGKTIWENGGRHFESIDVGRVSRDSAGKQIVVDIAHEKFQKGSLAVLDAAGRELGSYLCGDSRHHRLIDWNGDGLDEILVGQEQRLFDGEGHCVARLGPEDEFRKGPDIPPDEDHEPFALVGDLDGDQRPEIILYGNRRINIYRSEKAAKIPGLQLGTGVNVTLY